MNRFCTIFLMVLSTSFAEPPSYSYKPQAISTTYGAPEISTSYGAPEISTTYGAPSGWESVSTGYAYEPTVSSTHYTRQQVGYIPSEGAHIDYNLLEKVKQVLLQHEQSSGSSYVTVSRPSSSYGPPKSTYGPPGWESSGWQPSGWVSKVTDLHFDHPVQSRPAAYYIGTESYAPAHKGWQTVNSGWKTANKGWETANTGWKTANKGWETVSKGWAPASHTVAIAAPSSTYGVPRW